MRQLLPITFITSSRSQAFSYALYIVKFTYIYSDYMDNLHHFSCFLITNILGSFFFHSFNLVSFPSLLIMLYSNRTNTDSMFEDYKCYPRTCCIALSFKLPTAC